MRLLLLILPLIMISICVKSQDTNSKRLSDIEDELTQQKMINFHQKPDIITEKQIKGSPYLNKEFISSVILRTDKSILKDYQLRYNIYTDNMEFKEGKDVFNFAIPTQIETILLGDKIFVYAPYMTSKNIKHSYFQVLSDGNYQLYKRHEVVLIRPDSKSQAGDPYRFEPAPPHYFVRYRDGMVHQINSRKKLIKVLQPIPKQVLQYIQANIKNTKNEDELIKVIEFTILRSKLSYLSDLQQNN